MSHFGALYVTGNTTPMLAAHAGTKIGSGWTAFGNQHGDLTVTESASGGTLTCVPGKYMVHFTGSIQTDDVSGTSLADDAGIIQVQIRKDGVAVAGLVGEADSQDSGRPATIAVHGPVEIAATDAGVLSAYVLGVDAAGNDVTVLEAQFTAMLID